MSINDVFSVTIHDEILTEIFSGVPAKSVGKFRCLSKTWNTHLTTSHFINLHLSRNTHQQSLILLTQNSSIHTIKLPFENPTNSKKILELGNESSWYDLMGSCNGLVLLLIEQEKLLFLVNPTTLEQLQIPSIKINRMFGFGYDSFTHDYKIVTFHQFSANESIQVEVNLYSVKLGVWKRIEHSLTRFKARGTYRGVFVNGCLNWFVDQVKSGVLFTILAFDLVTEVFREIDVPWSINGPRSPDRMCQEGFAHGGCLCTKVPFHGQKMEIWMLKEYGNMNSWTKLTSWDGNGKWWMRVPLGIGKDEIVLTAYEELDGKQIANDEMMVVYNFEEGTVKKMVVNGTTAYFYDGCSFVDSLVSIRELTSSC